MCELISRQAAIDALNDWSNHSMTNAEAWHLRQVIGDIKSMPSAQPEPQWIPCNERLPFDAGYYLTTTTYNEVFCDYWDLNEWNRTEQVIAWMPMPEPYKGGQDGAV